MLPSCTRDAYGCDTILLKKENLQDFPALIEWIRQQGYGKDTGILKLRLAESDRRDDVSMCEIMTLLNMRFEEKVIHGETANKEFAYNPSAQLYFKASLEDDIYQYSNGSCTSDERAAFIKDAGNPALYSNPPSNCCSEVLQLRGLDGVRKHLFREICQGAPYTRSLIQREEEKEKHHGIKCKDLHRVTSQQSPIIHGAQINVDSTIKITTHFSLSELGTITDKLEEKYDGIATPYIYCGTTHSSFAWHVEDGGMFSINYLFAGSPKIWFGFASDCFGLVDGIAQTFCIEKSHTACRAFLLDHKALVADPHYFKDHHGIPYTVLLQEPGDFIITLPFALHSGFNLGPNLAMASNFGDDQWLEQGMYAPVCDCHQNQQVQLNLMPLLKVCRPDLLPAYCDATGSMFPENHPRQVKRFPSTAARVLPPKDLPSLLEDIPLAMRLVPKCRRRRKKPTLYCPECSQSYRENKMSRLKNHIEKVHSAKKDEVLRVVSMRYLPWKPKLSVGFTCRICGCFRRGSITQLKLHHSKKHTSLPFLGALK